MAAKGRRKTQPQMNADLTASGMSAEPAGLPHILQIPIEETLRGREVFDEPHQGSVKASHVVGADPFGLRKFRDRASAEHIKDQERPSQPKELTENAAARFVGGFLLFAHTGRIAQSERGGKLRNKPQLMQMDA
jgi:hypothetical protein